MVSEDEPKEESKPKKERVRREKKEPEESEEEPEEKPGEKPEDKPAEPKIEREKIVRPRIEKERSTITTVPPIPTGRENEITPEDIENARKAIRFFSLQGFNSDIRWLAPKDRDKAATDKRIALRKRDLKEPVIEINVSNLGTPDKPRYNARVYMNNHHFMLSEEHMPIDVAGPFENVISAVAATLQAIQADRKQQQNVVKETEGQKPEKIRTSELGGLINRITKKEKLSPAETSNLMEFAVFFEKLGFHIENYFKQDHFEVNFLAPDLNAWVKIHFPKTIGPRPAFSGKLFYSNYHKKKKVKRVFEGGVYDFKDLTRDELYPILTTFARTPFRSLEYAVTRGDIHNDSLQNPPKVGYKYLYPHNYTQNYFKLLT